MSRKIIKGISGSFEVLHWHVGDDVRLMIYNDEGNSIYYVINRAKAAQWAECMESGFELTLTEGRAATKFIKIGDKLRLESYDALFPHHRVVSIFNATQTAEIARALRKEKQE